jgi:CHASE3 domain sensor protein
MTDWLVRLVARVPVTVHAKLLAAFLAIAVLLIIVGSVGLQALGTVDQRAEDLVKLQRKIAAYRQLQHDTMSQLYSVDSAFVVPDERTLDATLRQLNQFGYDLDRLQFVAKDEVELLARVRDDYEQFIKIVTHAIQLIRGGKVTEGRQVEQTQAGPLADLLEPLTNELVNKAETDMMASIDATHESYLTSRRVVIGFAAGSIALALMLGYAIRSQPSPAFAESSSCGAEAWCRGGEPANRLSPRPSRRGRLMFLVPDPARDTDGCTAAGDRLRRFLPPGRRPQPRRAGHAGRQPQPYE